MIATKKMIDQEIFSCFKRIANRAAGYEDELQDIKKIEAELERIKFLIKEYHSAPTDYRDGLEQAEGKE